MKVMKKRKEKGKERRNGKNECKGKEGGKEEKEGILAFFLLLSGDSTSN